MTERPRRVYCPCCGKQVVRGQSPRQDDPHVAPAEGGKTGFGLDQVFCGFCAKDLDENGMFPEEAATCVGYEEPEPPEKGTVARAIWDARGGPAPPIQQRGFA